MFIKFLQRIGRVDAVAGEGALTELEGTEEVVLELPLQETLTGGIHRLPVPHAASDFNRQVLSTLGSGRDFAPWQEQVLARFQWMLLPAAAGFLVLFSVTLLFGRMLPPSPTLKPRTTSALTSPPLLPVKSTIFPSEPEGQGIGGDR